VTPLRVLLLLGLSLPGCATTSGREWLDAPIEPRAALSASHADFTPPEPPPESRPRLRQTVTLGESYEVKSSPSRAVASGPAVQVNVHNHIPVVVNNPIGYGYGYGYGYGAYGYGAGGGRAPTRATTRSVDTKVGADFPPVPDYGPRALR
jgi:hypothetical protein